MIKIQCGWEWWETFGIWRFFGAWSLDLGASAARLGGGRFSGLRAACGGLFTRGAFTRMAFNLKKVLKALLLSSSAPLSVKDIQAAFSRFHETATLPREDEEQEKKEPVAADAGGEGADAGELRGEGTAPPLAGDGEKAEEIVEPAEDPELYAEVPSLITGTQIREAMDQIAAELRGADDGLLLIEGNNGFRLVTHPRFARWVRILRSEPPPVKLSQSSIETLAIVAYRQPVTRGEIETIRGVSAEAGINKLLERELVYVVGRADLPGRPIQYGTTDKFLEFVGVKSLDELPASDVLSSRQIDEWLKTAMNPPALGDAEMGLPDEQLPLEAGAEASAGEAAEPEAEKGETLTPTDRGEARSATEEDESGGDETLTRSATDEGEKPASN